MHASSGIQTHEPRNREGETVHPLYPMATVIGSIELLNLCSRTSYQDYQHMIIVSFFILLGGVRLSPLRTLKLFILLNHSRIINR
jgi:hypothetical protein